MTSTAAQDAGHQEEVAQARNIAGLMPDHWIREYAEQANMITPFAEKQNSGEAGEKIISYGLSSYGYDARVSDEFMIFTNVYNAIVDPKSF